MRGELNLTISWPTNLGCMSGEHSCVRQSLRFLPQRLYFHRDGCDARRGNDTGVAWPRADQYRPRSASRRYLWTSRLCAPSYPRTPSTVMVEQLGWSGLGWSWLGWRLEHLEWMPTRLDNTGWKMRTLPMGMVRQTANSLAERWAVDRGEYRHSFLDCLCRPLSYFRHSLWPVATPNTRALSQSIIKRSEQFRAATL